MEKQKMEKQIQKKLETGAIQEVLDWMNEGWRRATLGLPYEKDIFGKDDDEIDPKTRKMIRQFEELLESGGIDQALEQVNEQYRAEIKREREIRKKKARALREVGMTY